MRTTYRLIILVLLATSAVYSQEVAPEQATPEQQSLGHLECLIRADTNCVTKTVTLEAWDYYLFTGVTEPLTVLWSTGVTAHKIVVTPPGSWSWDASNIGCEVVHQNNYITFDHPFFNGPIEITGPGSVPGELIVNTQGYNGFSDFEWNPPYTELTPYPVNDPGTYALTITDALGCDFTDEVSIFPGAACPNPPPPGGESCSTSCVYCDLDGYMGINNGSPSGGNTVCGQIAIHNDQWYGFVAGSDTITIEILTSNCQNGEGLQAAIFGDCSDPDAIVCNPGCGGCGGQTLTLSYTDFNPGQTYWLMVDGWVGDVCDYQIDVVDGSVTAPPPAPVAQPVGPLQVCPGATAVYSVPDAAGAGYYHWTAPAGASINGLSNNLLINAPQGKEVTITFGASGGQICVQAGNSCHPPSAQNCINVISQPIPPTIKPALILCHEDLPFTWDEEPFPTINVPGTFQLVSSPYSSSLDCDSIVRQTITILPPAVTNLANIVLCESECFGFAGESYCAPGNYSVVLENFQGCDSLVNFSLIYLNPVAQIQGPTQILCQQSSITLLSVPSQGVKIWTDASGQQLGTDNSLTVTQPGSYILSTTMTSGGVFCTKSDTVLVTQDTTTLDVQISGASDGCNTDSLFLSCVVTAGNALFEWSGPGGFSSSEQNPLVTLPGLYSVSVTTPDGCTGADSELVRWVGGTPDAFAYGDTINCINTPGLLDGGSATDGATYFWTGPNGYQSTDEDATVTLQGQYVLTVTGPGGCTNTASAFLLAQTDVPTVVVPEATMICINPVTLLCTTSAINPGYQWSGPNNFVSSLAQPVVTEPGNYSVTVTDLITGCTGTAEAFVFQILVDLPIQTDTIIHPTIGQSNGSINVTVGTPNGPVSYSWYSNGVLIAATEDVSNLPAGTYTIIVFDSFGCSNEATFVLTGVSSTSSIPSLSPWLVRPNPSAGRFELCCNGVDRTATRLLVHDYSGRLVFEQPVPQAQTSIQIDLTGVPSGVYFLEIREDALSTWVKLVVQR